jgi:hypothetical protein
MEQELRDNVLGAAAWRALDPLTRSFVATAEAVYRAHRRDAGFDFSGVVVDFAKAFELETNLILRQALRGVPQADRRVNVDGASVDLAGGRVWSLGELARVIGETQHVNTLLKRRLVHGEWFTASLPPVLNSLADLRNPAAHAECTTRQQASELRDRVLGVGSVGLLSELAKVRTR